MCNTNKKVYDICKENQDILCKILSKIPIRGTKPKKFYKCIKGLDYIEIIQFVTGNKLVNKDGITKPDYILASQNKFPISLNVLKFLMANGVSMSSTITSNYLSILSLDALKFLVEVKKINLEGYSIFDVNFSKVKYLSGKGYLPNKDEIKTVRLNSFSDEEKKKTIDLLKSEFKKRKP